MYQAKMTKILGLMAAIFFLSCTQEGELTQNGNVNPPVEDMATLKYSGNFEPTQGITVQGTVNVFVQNNQYQVQIENITISEGPDLKVYLSTSDSPTSFVNLGNFKGNGTSVYNVPQEVDITKYPYVLIHCQQYNHLFAVAQLISK